MIIEKVIVDHLNEGLDGVQAHVTIPNRRPDSFVVVERTGGNIENHVKYGMFVTDCYGPSVLAAADLCDTVISLMESLIEHDEVASVRLNSHYNDTDTALHEFKYGALFEITYY